MTWKEVYGNENGEEKGRIFSLLKILFYLGLNEILGGHIVKFKLD